MSMTATQEAPVRPARVSRAEDPRHPVKRLTALFDEGTLELITPDPNWAHLLPGGQAVRIHRDVDKTAVAISHQPGTKRGDRPMPCSSTGSAFALLYLAVGARKILSW